MCGRCGRGISGALYNMGEWDNGNRCKGISIHGIYLFWARVMGCDGDWYVGLGMTMSVLGSWLQGSIVVGGCFWGILLGAL